jgi:hypothetical protein
MSCRKPAPDYGIVALSVNGTNVGQPFDGYNSTGVTVNPSVDFGQVPLAAGANQLTFTVTRKNSASSSYLVGID